MYVWRHIQAILLLPGTATIIVPAILLFSNGDANPGCGLPAPFNFLPPLSGIFLICSGILLMIRTIALFAVFGQGTLAPWDPTRRLVVRGIYRHVRNPMISGVFCILAGETMLFGSLLLFYWFLVFVTLNVIYIPLVEERSLEDRFDGDYILYKKNVRRWLPRIQPWMPPWDGAADPRG